MFDQIDILNSLSESEKNTLSLFCQKRLLKSWDLLFKEGEEATSMYFLVSWLLEAKKEDWKILGVVNPGEPVWEMAIFESTWKRWASVYAIKDSELIVLLSFSVKELTQKHPDIFEKIKWVISERNTKNS